MTPAKLLNKLPEEERLEILMLGSTYYLPKIESRLARAREKVEFFREKYGCAFGQFEKKNYLQRVVTKNMRIGLSGLIGRKF